MGYEKDRYTAWGVIRPLGGSEQTRIKILAFRSGSRWEYDSEAIREQFPPNGFVFGPSFFRRWPEFMFGQTIQFEAVMNPLTDIREDHDEWVIDHKGESPRVEGWEIVETPIVVEVEGRLDLEGVSRLTFPENQPFYLLSRERIVGPVKYVGSQLLPEGIETKSWPAIEAKICMFEEGRYVREKPKSLPALLDSANDAQLVTWLKTELKKQSSPIISKFDKHPEVKQAITEMLANSSVPLFDARMKRIKSAITNFDFQFNEIQRFVEASPYFQAVYQAYLVQQESKVKAEIESRLISENQDLTGLEIKKLEVEDRIKGLEFKNNELRVEQEFLLSNREKIVLEMRLLIHSGLTEQPPKKMEQPRIQQFYDLSTYLNDALPVFESPEKFAASYRSILFKNGMTVKKSFAEGMPSFLREYNAILIPDTRFASCFAEASNNATIIIQQVEPDWLKFESCWNAGLAKILTEAIENPTRLHFLVFEDINLASPECWGKPLFSVQSRQRAKFPILGCGWPKNFWLFGTKIRSKEPQSIGLPIFESTFKKWGGIYDTFHSPPKPDLENQPQGLLGIVDLLQNWDLEGMEIPHGNAIPSYFDVTNDD